MADIRWQFRRCSTVRHHARTAFEDESLLDDARGFNLAPPATRRLPPLKAWGRPHYDARRAAFGKA